MLVMQMPLDRNTLLIDCVTMLLCAVTIVLAGDAKALNWSKLLQVYMTLLL
jgi:hypothetical protein